MILLHYLGFMFNFKQFRRYVLNNFSNVFILKSI